MKRTLIDVQCMFTIWGEHGIQVGFEGLIPKIQKKQ